MQTSIQSPQDFKWVCTDPDNLQFCKKLPRRNFLFKEYCGESDLIKKELCIMAYEGHETESILEQSGNWCEGNINLNDYSVAQLDEFAKCGYGGLSDCINICGESSDQIIAELIWESEM